MQKKKTVIVFIALTVMLLSAVRPLEAEAAAALSVAVNNQIISSNVPPLYSDGIIMVPAKEFVQALGGTFNYDRASMTGTVSQGENELVFRLDNRVVKHNGKYIQAPAAMKVIGNRFMVPAQFVAEKLGCGVYMHTYRNTLMVFQPVNGKITYRVASGDTLWILSQVFGASISTIRQLNNLTGDMLYVGQMLTVRNFSPFNAAIPAFTSANATLFSGAGFGFSVVS